MRYDVYGIRILQCDPLGVLELALPHSFAPGPCQAATFPAEPGFFFIIRVCISSLGKHTCRNTDTAMYVKDTETANPTKHRDEP